MWLATVVQLQTIVFNNGSRDELLLGALCLNLEFVIACCFMPQIHTQESLMDQYGRQYYGVRVEDDERTQQVTRLVVMT